MVFRRDIQVAILVETHQNHQLMFPADLLVLNRLVNQPAGHLGDRLTSPLMSLLVSLLVDQQTSLLAILHHNRH